MSCISATRCPKCDIIIQCDSSVPSKVGTIVNIKDKKVIYVDGPCCCILTICPSCKYNWSVANAIDLLIKLVGPNDKRWNIMAQTYEKFTRLSSGYTNGGGI